MSDDLRFGVHRIPQASCAVCGTERLTMAFYDYTPPPEDWGVEDLGGVIQDNRVHRWPRCGGCKVLFPAWEHEDHV
jgi:hypothetical protein